MSKQQDDQATLKSLEEQMAQLEEFVRHRTPFHITLRTAWTLFEDEGTMTAWLEQRGLRAEKSRITLRGQFAISTFLIS